jgi:hypothetical protein
MNRKSYLLFIFILLLSFNALAQQPTPVLSLADSNLKVFVGGKIRTTMFMSNKRTFPSGTAFLLLPKDATGEESSFDLNARSSSLYFALDGPKVGDFKLGGMMFFMLTSNVTSETYGILPSLLYVDLKNDHWRFAFGQQMFNDVPVVISKFSMTFPDDIDYVQGEFSSDGNFKGISTRNNRLPSNEMGRDPRTQGAGNGQSTADFANNDPRRIDRQSYSLHLPILFTVNISLLVQQNLPNLVLEVPA